MALSTKSIIKGELITEDVVEDAVIRKMKSIFTVKKARDIIKGVNIKSVGNVTYALLGIENQSLIHYAMPVRNLLYDALNYASQVSEIEKDIRKNGKGLSRAEFLSGFTKGHKIYPVVTLVINWDSKKCDGPNRLSEMFAETDPSILKYVDDYVIKLLDPHDITDFSKFNSALGDVFEFIKEQRNESFLVDKLKEKGNSWELDVDSVNVINAFAGANISTEFEKEGVVDMCRATEALVEKGIVKGLEKGEVIKLIKMVCRKIEKGKSVEGIAEDLEENQTEIQRIYNVAKELEPDLDPEMIYDKLKDNSEE